MSCNKMEMGDLDAYVHGELSAAEAHSLEAHLFGCADCATELRHLREEKRLFQARAEADDSDVPAFADILARMNREESTVVANDPELNRGRPAALLKKTEPVRAKERKHGFPRWAQAFVACSATAAAAGSLLSVTPPKSEDTATTYTHRDEMEIGADPICTTDNRSASAEVLASLPPPREVWTNVVNPHVEEAATCSEHHAEDCDSEPSLVKDGCDQLSSAVCGQSGP